MLLLDARADLDATVKKLQAAGLSAVVVAVATHTYRTGGVTSRRDATFSEDVRQLELAGSDVRVVRHPGGVAAFAGVRKAANTRGAV